MIRLAFQNLKPILQFWPLALAILKKKHNIKHSHEGEQQVVFSFISYGHKGTIIAMGIEIILQALNVIQLHAVEGNNN